MTDLQTQLSHAVYYLREYDEPLRRYRACRAELKTELIETYPHKYLGGDDDDDYDEDFGRGYRLRRAVVKRWSNGNAERDRIRNELDELDRKFRPVIEKQKRLQTLVKSLQREIQKLQVKQKSQSPRQVALKLHQTQEG